MQDGFWHVLSTLEQALAGHTACRLRERTEKLGVYTLKPIGTSGFLLNYYNNIRIKRPETRCSFASEEGKGLLFLTS